MKAIIEGIDYCHTHSAEEIANAIQASFSTTDKSLLVKSLVNYKSIDAWTKIPYMTEDSFDGLQNILLWAETIEEKIDYDTVVDNSILDRITKK